MSQSIAKLCKNGCGQEIVWDNANRYFLNVANNERHMCPNFTPRQRSQDIKQTYQPQQRFSQTPTADQSSQREEIKAMAQEKNTIAKETNQATRELAESTKALAVAQHEIATQMELDRMQRQEFHEDFMKEGKKQENAKQTTK